MKVIVFDLNKVQTNFGDRLKQQKNIIIHYFYETSIV
jgi:hypothetical protein